MDIFADPRHIIQKSKFERRVAGLRDSIPDSEVAPVKVYSAATGKLLRIERPNKRRNSEGSTKT